jgi:tetratricopeptide (TPR) repeat protein
MYQRKIAQWELDKKHKAPEMRAILRLAREAEAAGQESIFRIRARRVDIEEVLRYFKRKGEDPIKLDVRESPIPPTITVETSSASGTQTNNHDVPSEYFFLTAPYRNAASGPLSERGSFSTSTADSSSGSSTRSDSVVSTPLVFTDGPLACQMIPNYPQLGMPIDITFEDQCSRILLHLTQLFFDAVVPPAFFSTERSTGVILQPWRRTLSSWSRATSEGYELMQRGQSQASFALRSRAMDSVPKHITNPSPIILFRYFEIIYAMCSEGDLGFLDVTLKHVLAMSKMYLPPGHPIRELTRLLLHPQLKPIVGDLAQQGIRKSLQILFERCGPSHPRILYVLDSRTQAFLDDKKYQEACKEASRYRERAELLRGDSSYEACQALRMLGDAYVGQGRIDDAIAAYEIAFDRHRYLKVSEDRGVIGVRTKRGLAGIAKSRAQYPEAEEHLQMALQIARDAFGEKDVQVTLVQDDLDALHESVRQARGELAYRPLDA